MGVNTMRLSAESVVVATIPSMFEQLKRAAQRYEIPPVVVLCHDAASDRAYGFRTLDGATWIPPAGSLLVAYALLKPLREFYESKRGKKRALPHLFIAFDLELGHAWHAHSFKRLPNVPVEARLDAETLDRATTGRAHFEMLAETSVPQVIGRARRVQAGELEHLRRDLGAPSDSPEEVFLLHEELLTMAVDSLKDTEVLDPLPVHTNAVWVFERPVKLLRSDRRERAVYAVWFRQGQAVWRIRAYVLKGSVSARRIEVTGEQLSGPVPFVPRWDVWHPEQKLLAAVWALMQQGGLTQSEPVDESMFPKSPLAPETVDPDLGLHVVRVKTGTEHADVYRQDETGWSARSAWSVRGHWRRQPYASLGIDEHGKALTKLIWIASYTKGEPGQEPAASKIIEVR